MTIKSGSRRIWQGRTAFVTTSLVGMLVGSTHADTFVWDGELSQDWHTVSASGDKTNWNPERLPGASDYAQISGTHVSINEAVTIRDLDVFSSLAIGRNLTVGNDASISNLNISGGLLGGGRGRFASTRTPC